MTTDTIKFDIPKDVALSIPNLRDAHETRLDIRGRAFMVRVEMPAVQLGQESIPVTLSLDEANGKSLKKATPFEIVRRIAPYLPKI